MSVALLHVPAVQRGIACRVSDVLSDVLASRVSVKNVSIGLFNRIVVDDIDVSDQNGQPLFSCHRASVKIAIMPLLEGRTVITSAQLFGADVRLKRLHKDAALNCQFILDLLSSDDSTSQTPIDLQIASLVVRNSAIRYDVGKTPLKKSIVDPNHLHIEKLSAHVMLNTLTSDTLSVRMKKLSFREKNSGLMLQRLSFAADAGRYTANVRNLEIQTEYSDVYLDVSAELNDGEFQRAALVSDHSSVASRDLSLFVAGFPKIDRNIFIDATLKADTSTVTLSRCDISTAGRDLNLKLNGEFQTDINLAAKNDTLPHVKWQLELLEANIGSEMLGVLLDSFGADAAVASRIGNVTYTAEAEGSNTIMEASGRLECAAGKIAHSMSFADGCLRAEIETDSLLAGQILATDKVGTVNGHADIKMNLSPDMKEADYFSVDMKMPAVTVLRYPYKNVTAAVKYDATSAEMHFDVDDINAQMSAHISAHNVQPILSAILGKENAVAVNEKVKIPYHIANRKNSNVILTADVRNFNPQALNLTEKYDATVFSGSVKVDVGSFKPSFSLASLLDDVEIDVRDLHIESPVDRYVCDSLKILSKRPGDGVRQIALHSDFAEMHASGHFDITTLQQSLTNLVSSKVPTLPGLPQYVKQSNDIQLTARISDIELVRRLTGIDIAIGGDAVIDAYINDNTGQANILVNAGRVRYGKNSLEDIHFSVYSPDDSLHYEVKTAWHDTNDGVTELDVRGSAAGNNIDTKLTWDINDDKSFCGSLNTSSRFYSNKDGKDIAHISISPSEVLIGDSLWHIDSSEIVYSDNYLKVDNFLLHHGMQYVGIDGLATASNTDSLNVALHDVNVSYILNLVNFHSVDFEGYASGDVVVKSLFKDLDASAQLDVRDFRFEKGRMGTLTVYADWDNADGQVNLRAQCADDNVIPIGYFLKERQTTGTQYGNAMLHDGRTLINGYISAKRNYIDLDINAHNTRAEFVKSFCSSFLDDVNVWANGRARLWGDLKKINLTGSVVANGTVLVTPLNAEYTLKNDTVNFLPSDIEFANCNVYDRYGNKAVVKGALHHTHLSRMTYDIDVEADKMLCYDFPALAGTSFGGYVIASGTCRITGRPGETVFDIEAYPEESTEIIYNVSSPDALQNQEFITWRDKAQSVHYGTLKSSEEVNATSDNSDEFRSDMRLNFLIHANPACTLRLIMDDRTGDYITLNGNGTLRANYYNKGGMHIYGNYNVVDGEYKMTIQQLITKSFRFLPGGTIAFGGEPFKSAINLQAQYVVPSVPLSDLNIGNSFANNTVKVNCLMNITGTAEQPRVDFDLNLPQASADVQQMITSIMDSEQKRNQQVVYLLSVGRFYAADNNALTETGQSQASLAMQSFLSGTLSQQINNVISDVILKNRNWNFGANVSPGDEGMMNAEYEGLISGRMFNNRLQVNGQFGYRDNPNATTSFIGDFDVRYLLLPNGNLQVRVYNQTSDRYFSKSTLNTQGIGVVFKHDFNSFLPVRRDKTEQESLLDSIPK